MSHTLTSQVAEEIRAKMARDKLSQRALARKLERSANWVSIKVSGDRAIDLEDLEAIAEALGVKPGDLLPLSRRYPVLDQLEAPPQVTYLPDLPTIRSVDQTRPVRLRASA